MEAQARFRAHVENPKESKDLPSEYAVPVYKIVLKSGGQREFDQVWQGLRLGLTAGYSLGEGYGAWVAVMIHLRSPDLCCSGILVMFASSSAPHWHGTPLFSRSRDPWELDIRHIEPVMPGAVVWSFSCDVAGRGEDHLAQPRE